MDTMPKTIAFNNASKNRDHNIYTEEFFGGADQYIYIGGQRYEDISAIQWTVRETLKPIYGYSSRKFDDIAVGTRIVQGAIRVPVRNTNVDINTNTSYEVSSLTNIGTEEIPHWVYKYSPEAKGTNNIGYSSSSDASTISKVQNILKSKYGNIEVNGSLDMPTRKAIEEYKRENNLLVNDIIDSELLNRMNLQDDVRTTVGTVKLRYSPQNNSESFEEISAGTKIILLKEYGDWCYVQGNDNVKGYIKRNEVI